MLLSLPRGTMAWPAVCDCAFSWSCSFVLLFGGRMSLLNESAEHNR